jgi:hypothetical protein
VFVFFQWRYAVAVMGKQNYIADEEDVSVNVGDFMPQPMQGK